MAAIKHVNFLPQTALITLYQTLVESRLRYCNTVWGNCGNSLKSKRQKLQNRALRAISKTKYNCDDPEALLKEKGWLNVQQLIDFDTAVMVHKSLNNCAPSYLTELFTKPNMVHSHNTRSANNGLYPTQANMKFGQRSFSHYGCHIWNDLDRDTQSIEQISKLKKKR